LHTKISRDVKLENPEEVHTNDDLDSDDDENENVLDRRRFLRRSALRGLSPCLPEPSHSG
jgi:hypothetical protein